MHRLVALALLVGCAPGGGGGSDPDPDVGATDVAVVDALVADAALPDAAPEPCVPAFVDRTRPLDEDGPDTQIHAAVWPTARGVWVVYNRPDPGGGFDVWAARVGCDGRVDIGPFQVNEDAEHNDVDPDVAVSGDRVLFAWATDDGTAPYNLSVRLRVFDTSGEAVGDEWRRPHEGNAWMVRAAATADGFAVVGVEGDAELGVFQVFRQALDRDGVPVGEPERFEADPEGQVDPAVSPNGEVVAWTVGAQAGGRIRVAQGGEVSDAFDFVGASAALGDGWVAATDTERWGPTARRLDAAELLAIGNGMGTDHTPALATDGDTTVVAYYRVERGIRNELRYHVVGEGNRTHRIVTHGPVAPYPPAIAAIGDRRFLLAWSEGESPAFRVHYRIIEAEGPP